MHFVQSMNNIVEKSITLTELLEELHQSKVIENLEMKNRGRKMHSTLLHVNTILLQI